MKDSKIELTVAVNAFFAQHPFTGSGQYLTNLLPALCKVAPLCRIVTYSPDRHGQAHQLRSTERVSHLAKLRFEQLALPAAARHCGVLHYPYWAAPLRCSTPVVVTVHDIIPAVLKAYRGPFLARAYTMLAGLATRRAAVLMTDSEASKRDIVARLRVPPERVHVVYLAADQAFVTIDPSEHASVVDKYALRSPFIFYVGGLDQRKNVEGLIEGFARALPSMQGATLAIAGDHLRRGALFPDLPSLVRRLGLEENVRFLGVVPAGDLPVLYQAAAGVAFPSWYEGFGLPPLEALACGAVVLCSNASSLPEIVGDAAILLAPDDVDAWAGALVRLISDAALGAELSRRGPARAASFSWQRTALATLEVYREAAMRGPREDR